MTDVHIFHIAIDPSDTPGPAHLDGPEGRVLNMQLSQDEPNEWGMPHWIDLPESELDKLPGNLASHVRKALPPLDDNGSPSVGRFVGEDGGLWSIWIGETRVGFLFDGGAQVSATPVGMWTVSDDWDFEPKGARRSGPDAVALVKAFLKDAEPSLLTPQVAAMIEQRCPRFIDGLNETADIETLCALADVEPDCVKYMAPLPPPTKRSRPSGPDLG